MINVILEYLMNINKFMVYINNLPFLLMNKYEPNLLSPAFYIYILNKIQDINLK